MRHATKADWADAKAQEMEDRAFKILDERVEMQKVRRKYQSADHCRQEAAKFRRLAAYYRKHGK
mgnify:CR=1 FL=1